MTGIFDARNAQGAINNAQANEINQYYGRQTTVDTDGGDAAGRDIVDNSVNIFLTVLGGNPEPNREPILNKLKKVLEEVDDPSIRQALRNCFKDRPIPTTEDTTEIIEQLGLEQLLKLIERGARQLGCRDSDDVVSVVCGSQRHDGSPGNLDGCALVRTAFLDGVTKSGMLCQGAAPVYRSATPEGHCADDHQHIPIIGV